MIKIADEYNEADIDRLVPLLCELDKIHHEAAPEGKKICKSFLIVDVFFMLNRTRKSLALPLCYKKVSFGYRASFCEARVSPQ